jgi:hypothetical protein
LFILLSFCIVHILSLFDLRFFHNFLIFSLFNLAFIHVFHIFSQFSCGRKASRTVIRYGQYRRQVSWIVKR